MKQLIKNYRKNQSKELYKEIVFNYFKNYKLCKYCNDVIYYYDSLIRLSKSGKLYLDKKSYLTNKIIDNKKYNLCVCEDCLTKKFPKYQEKNKSKVFNMVNEITAYAFDIPDEIWKKWRSKNYRRTLENYINNFGEIEGKKKWEEYERKQAYSNSFKYKKEKYGWTKKEYNEFNKSRAVTLDNLVKKHGEKEGLEVWNNYIERQRYTCSKEYFIEEYGEKEGLEKWNNWIEKRIFLNGYSEVSQEFFKELDKKLNNYTTYYQEKNQEWFIRDSESIYFLDFFIKELNIAVEFNGDLYDLSKKTQKSFSFCDEFDKNNSNLV